MSRWYLLECGHYGANARPERVLDVAKLMPTDIDLRCIGEPNGDGTPRHPLMPAYSLPLQAYDLQPRHARAGT